MYVHSPLSMSRLKMYIYIRDTVHCSLFITYNLKQNKLYSSKKPETKFIRKRNDSAGEQESGRNDSRASGKVDETTQGRNNSG